jgi:hypothetical protein
VCENAISNAPWRCGYDSQGAPAATSWTSSAAAPFKRDYNVEFRKLGMQITLQHPRQRFEQRQLARISNCSAGSSFPAGT